MYLFNSRFPRHLSSLFGNQLELGYISIFAIDDHLSQNLFSNRNSILKTSGMKIGQIFEWANERKDCTWYKCQHGITYIITNLKQIKLTRICTHWIHSTRLFSNIKDHNILIHSTRVGRGIPSIPLTELTQTIPQPLLVSR